MRRLWFKEEMKGAIMLGRKSATTRAHPLKVGETYLAVSGSRYKAKPFCRVKITSQREIDLLTEHCSKHFRREGFKSSVDMALYIRKNLPEYLTKRPLYYHTFIADVSIHPEDKP